MPVMDVPLARRTFWPNGAGELKMTLEKAVAAEPAYRKSLRGG
jgi:hypothetical protein